jgi:hypothetical protein
MPSIGEYHESATNRDSNIGRDGGSLSIPRVGLDPRPLLGLGDAIRSIPTLRSQGSRCGRKDPDHTRERNHRSRWGVGFFMVCPTLLSVCSPRPLALGPKRREGADAQKLKISPA